jgi:hypothetical protein
MGILACIRSTLKSDQRLNLAQIRRAEYQAYARDREEGLDVIRTSKRTTP